MVGVRPGMMGVPVSSSPAAGLDADLIIGIQGRAGPGWQDRRGAAGSLQSPVCQSQLRQQQPHTSQPCHQQHTTHQLNDINFCWITPDRRSIHILVSYEMNDNSS